jgi:hypothetical protein
MVAWRRVSAKAKLLAMLGTILVALAASWVVVPSLTSDEVAVAETTKRPDREAREVEAALQRQRLLDEMQEAERAHEEEFRRADEAAAKRQAELEAALVATPVKRRRIKSYRWEAPEDALARVWNIPNADAVEAEATALLRIFINEADGQELDSHGIWQVLRTIRSRSCDRSMRRRITDCEEYEHRGETRYRETLLSAMRRMSKAVVDENILQRTKRQRWTSQVELSCERPRNYPGNEKTWRFQYGVRCPRRAELARKLVSGQEDVNLVEGVTLIAWGGQCRPGQACDNPHGLSSAAVPGGDKDRKWLLVSQRHQGLPRGDRADLLRARVPRRREQRSDRAAAASARGDSTRGVGGRGHRKLD